MAWVPLSEDDVQNSLTEQEQSGLSTGSAQSDLSVIVQSVTGLVRGKVNAAKRNQGHLGPAGTIPDELYAAAISIARFKFLTHLPGTQLITQDRRADKDEAIRQLEDVAEGKIVVVRGDDVTGQTPILGAESGASANSVPVPIPYGTPPGDWENWELW